MERGPTRQASFKVVDERALRINGPTLALQRPPAEPHSRPVGGRVLTAAAAAMNSGGTATGGAAGTVTATGDAESPIVPV